LAGIDDDLIIGRVADTEFVPVLVEIRFELRRATDQFLIVHVFERFSDLSIRKLWRETCYRFLAPADELRHE
jgi:hypothetical protein